MTAPEQGANAELARRFRTRISTFIRKYATTLEVNDSQALLRQFTPDARELSDIIGFSDDPLHEEDADIHPFGDVVHKYPNKLLYLSTDECPVYCRYCTRKRKTLLSQGHESTHLSLIAEYLESHSAINEVIFSGGDPLMLPPKDFLLRARTFLNVQSIDFLRLHTRALTTAPNLLSAGFLAALADLRTEFAGKTIAFVAHINTASEISDRTREAVEALNRLGIRCYAQTVLLRDVNDDAQTLALLCKALSAAGVQPYYLHQLDRVTGSAHFEVPDDEALQIYAQLKQLVPRYLVPEFVRDSKQGKKPVA